MKPIQFYKHAFELRPSDVMRQILWADLVL
jgi:hypothetical protein